MGMDHPTQGSKPVKTFISLTSSPLKKSINVQMYNLPWLQLHLTFNIHTHTATLIGLTSCYGAETKA